jgi:serine/threonine-protein kinase HipA
MAYRRAAILFEETPAGIIEEYEGGYRFIYDETYRTNIHSQPVSLTLPLDQQRYESPTLFSFFDGLIPEGWLLEIALKTWKLDRRDRFGLLLSVCKDPIGAVSVEAIS